MDNKKVRGIIYLSLLLIVSVCSFVLIDNRIKQQVNENTIFSSPILLNPSVSPSPADSLPVALYYNLSDPSKAYIFEEGIFKEVEIIT